MPCFHLPFLTLCSWFFFSSSFSIHKAWKQGGIGGGGAKCLREESTLRPYLSLATGLMLIRPCASIEQSSRQNCSSQEELFFFVPHRAISRIKWFFLVYSPATGHQDLETRGMATGDFVILMIVCAGLALTSAFAPPCSGCLLCV
jgi:hypothetical protein